MSWDQQWGTSASTPRLRGRYRGRHHTGNPQVKRWLRRVRGAVGLGLAWAAGWAPIGFILGLVNFTSGAAALGSGAAWLALSSAVVAASGFLCGASFSAVLRITEGHRRFDQMSLPRFAGWGGLGGVLGGGLLLAMSASFGGSPGLISVLTNLAVFGLLGAGSSVGSLALARGADERELLTTSEDLADVGLTEEESRELLGG